MGRFSRHVNIDGRWYKPGDEIPAELAGRDLNPSVVEQEADGGFFEEDEDPAKLLASHDASDEEVVTEQPSDEGSEPAGGAGVGDPPAAGEGTGEVEEVPDGTVADIEAWVGDDPARAQRALEVEQGKGDDARKTLVAHLQNLTSATGSTGAE